MALQMTRPTKHPKTGTFLVRLAIPADLRETTKRLFGVQAELRANLGTKDPAEAKRLAPAAVDKLHAMLDRARCTVMDAPEYPSSRQIAALAGEDYRRRVGASRDQEEQDLRWDIAFGLAEPEGDGTDASAQPGDSMVEARAEALLREYGFATDTETVARLAAALDRADRAYADLVKRRMHGDWSPDPNLPTFPELPHKAPDKAPQTVFLSFDALLSGWAHDHGYDLSAKPVARAAYDRQRTIERLAVFLGHRDVARVSKADAVRWKEEMQARGLSVPTIRNDLSEMSAVWRWGVRNGKVKANPFEGVSPPKERGRKRQRRAFTEAEAVAVLTAARANKGFMRWLPWVCCLTGARLSEVCQANKSDVIEIDGVSALRITDEGDEDRDGMRSVKNEDSRRDVPLHPALIAEGFLDYVRALPTGSPLFPDAKPDKVFGLRSTNAGKKLSRWMKADLNITDPRISPNHSWRHYFVGACRRVSMHPEVRSALTGHSAKMDESAAYGDSMKAFIHVLAENMAKVPCPIPPLGNAVGSDRGDKGSPRTPLEAP
jgi:integrase